MQALQIDIKLKRLVQTERKITGEILSLIRTIDRLKSYRELGYSSLFEYLTKSIGYSEGSAQRRISSARLLSQIPNLQADLQSGSLNLTQISLAQTAIRQEEKSTGQKVELQAKIQVLEKLRHQTSFQTQKILKNELPSFEMPKPKVIVQADGKVSVYLSITEKDYEKVKGLLAAYSHKIPDQRLESLLIYFAESIEKKKRKQIEKATLQNRSEQMPKHSASPEKAALDFKQVRESASAAEEGEGDPLPPPLRRHQKYSTSADAGSQKVSQNARKALSSQIKAVVFHQAQNQCQYFSEITQRRCVSKHFLEIEHVHPKALGGTDELQNLRLYCREHNALAAKIWGLG